MTEIWKPIAGWQRFYEVSSHGRIRSLARRIKRCNGIPMMIRARIMRTPRGSHGYKCCNLTRGGISTTICVHVAVATAFFGKCPKGQEVRHKNGKKPNCRASNLEYGSDSQNMRDRERHGTVVRGKKNGSTKLHVASVRRIRRLASTTTYASLAREYGVSESTISLVVSGKNWSWL